MNASLTVDGFGFTPDDALADLADRCARHAGWHAGNRSANVIRGRNPYSDIPVWGYVASIVLGKEVSS
jgi:hypothetical protein